MLVDMQINKKNGLRFVCLIWGFLLCANLCQGQSCEAGGRYVQPNCDCPGCEAYFNNLAPGQAQPTPAMDPSVQQPAPIVDDATDQPSDTTVPDVTAEPSLEQNDALPDFDFNNTVPTSVASTSAGVSVPDMIGDFFGNGYLYRIGSHGASVTAAGGDRRFKTTENNSPFPRNRVFFNYNHFHNAVTNAFGERENVNRYTFGVESTIFNEFNSIELRVPFAGTVAANQDLADPNFDSTEFGNISIAFKRLIFRNECSAVAVGLGVSLPTGDDSVITSSGVPQVIFNNDSVHFQPFLGVYRKVDERLFWQFFTQVDFDANGNRFVLPSTSGLFGISPPANNISETLQDQTLLFLDLSVGYWLYKDDYCRGYLTGLAPMLELHYTTTLQDQDLGNLGVFVPIERRDVLNLTAGMFFQIGQMSSLKVGVVSPLREDFDKIFDAEVGVQFVRRF